MIAWLLVAVLNVNPLQGSPIQQFETEDKCQVAAKEENRATEHISKKVVFVCRKVNLGK